MSISIGEVERIAKLARLKFTDQEKIKLQTELSSILNYVDQLKEVQTNVASEFELEGANLMRDDIAEITVEAEDVIAQAPAKDGKFVKVKSILE